VGNKVTLTNLKKTFLFKKTAEELEVWQATKKTQVINNDVDCEAFMMDYTEFRKPVVFK
jgi:hypothetical protein